MKKLLLKTFCLMLLIIGWSSHSFSQSSLLVNLGSNDCGASSLPSFSILKDPLGPSSYILANCSMSARVADYYFILIAYNPSDNKIYINDSRTTGISKVWVIDMGLPGSIQCPSIPVTPTYTLNYSTNHFEFDKNGKLWSINNYNGNTGQANIEQLEITTGNVIFSKTLQFPADHFPTNIGSGDISILPNGRMFATFGDLPSRLYEIKNYTSGTDNATGSFLQDIPKNTYGIAYLNGQLEVTGTNSIDSCYYFDYNISSNTLGALKVFQNGQAPIDNTSISPVVGITKELKSVTKINSTTADVTYEVYVKNMGNTIIQNINVADDLEKVFGTGNVSSVTTNFIAGFNTPGLTLNSGYNGTTNINLLNNGQNLVNQTSTTENYLFKLQIKCRVTNLQSSVIYYNSAIATGTIGVAQTLINTRDSSNNGPSTAIDPNNNNIANELGENIPTPLNWAAIVPVQFIGATAQLQNNASAIIKWQIATPTINANSFEVEYSTDGITWNTLNKIKITNVNQSSYQTTHTTLPAGNLFYRIKQVDNNGLFIYSKIIMLNNNVTNSFSVYPNPASNYIKIERGYTPVKNTTLELLNAVGQKLLSKEIRSASEELQTGVYPNGTYLLKVMNTDEVKTYKILIEH